MLFSLGCVRGVAIREGAQRGVVRAYHGEHHRLPDGVSGAFCPARGEPAFEVTQHNTCPVDLSLQVKP